MSKKSLRTMTQNERNRANQKPDDKLPEMTVYRDRMYGVYHVVKDGKPVCGMVDAAQIGEQPSTRRPTCVFCIEKLPKKARDEQPEKG